MEVMVLIQVLMVVLVEVEVMLNQQDQATLQAHHLLKGIMEEHLQVMIVQIMEQVEAVEQELLEELDQEQPVVMVEQVQHLQLQVLQ